MGPLLGVLGDRGQCKDACDHYRLRVHRRCPEACVALWQVHIGYLRLVPSSRSSIHGDMHRCWARPGEPLLHQQPHLLQEELPSSSVEPTNSVLVMPTRSRPYAFEIQHRLQSFLRGGMRLGSRQLWVGNRGPHSRDLALQGWPKECYQLACHGDPRRTLAA